MLEPKEKCTQVVLSAGGEGFRYPAPGGMLVNMRWEAHNLVRHGVSTPITLEKASFLWLLIYWGTSQKLSKDCSHPQILFPPSSLNLLLLTFVSLLSTMCPNKMLLAPLTWPVPPPITLVPSMVNLPS